MFTKNVYPTAEEIAARTKRFISLPDPDDLTPQTSSEHSASLPEEPTPPQKRQPDLHDDGWSS